MEGKFPHFKASPTLSSNTSALFNTMMMTQAKRSQHRQSFKLADAIARLSQTFQFCLLVKLQGLFIDSEKVDHYYCQAQPKVQTKASAFG